MVLTMILAGCGGAAPPPLEAAGRPETAGGVIGASAELLQRTPPLRKHDLYLQAFHVLKEDPEQQLEVHLYCARKNADLMQCAIYDGNTVDANLIGTEYIISELLYRDLPEEERSQWHPHNYEILAGLMVAPGLPGLAEVDLIEGTLINSYGRSWHVWTTSGGDRLPTGEPHLAWSFNADGEIDPALVDQRDDWLGVETAEIREARSRLAPYARPQEGIDAMEQDFPSRGGAPEGVRGS